MGGITKEDLRSAIEIYKLAQKDMQNQHKVIESIEQSTWEMGESTKRRIHRMEVMEQRIVQRLDVIGQRVDQRVSAMEQQAAAMEQRVGAMEQRLVEAERTVERLSLSKHAIRQAQPSHVKADNKNADAPVDPPIAKQGNKRPSDDAAPRLLKKQALGDNRVE